MLDDRSSTRRRIAGLGATALTAAASLAGAGYTVAQVDAPSVTEARSAGQNVPPARSAGQNVPPASTAPSQPALTEANRRWLYARHTSPRYRSLRKSTGTHKQNRRRALAGRGA